MKQMNFDFNEVAPFDPIGKSSFSAANLGQCSQKLKTKKTRFDINENVDYTRQVLVDTMNSILKDDGVATIYIDWHVDIIYSVFDRVFGDEIVLKGESFFKTNKSKCATHYSVRKSRNFTNEEVKAIK